MVIDEHPVDLVMEMTRVILFLSCRKGGRELGGTVREKAHSRGCRHGSVQGASGPETDSPLGWSFGRKWHCHWTGKTWQSPGLRERMNICS